MLLTGVRMATSAKILKIQKSLCGILMLIFTGFLVTSTLKAQDTAPATPTGQFGGVITATNNGVSIIPSFTLLLKENGGMSGKWMSLELIYILLSVPSLSLRFK